ncbi:MAG: hypothetical protein ACXVB0_17080 [Mucilaginibacter sp.]
MKMLFLSTVKISEKKFEAQAYKYASYMRKILVISGLMMPSVWILEAVNK